MLEMKEKDADGFLVVSVEELEDFARMNRVDESDAWTTKQWRIQAVKLLQAVANRKIKVVNTRENCEPVELTLQPVRTIPGLKNWGIVRYKTEFCMEIRGDTGILYEFKDVRHANLNKYSEGVYAELDAAGNPLKFDKIEDGLPDSPYVLVHLRNVSAMTDLMLEDLRKTYQLS